MSVALPLTFAFTKPLIMILNFPHPQYFISIEKGDTVQYGIGTFRVQEDKGWLYIYPNINGKRKKIDVRDCLFEFGTYADWIFNGWADHYTWPEYESFTKHELLCVTTS